MHLENFAPRGELAAAFALVVVHGLHEIDFVVGVIALAGRRIDLPAAFDFAAALTRAAFNALGQGSDFDRAAF